jgi:hypothetical protein
MRNIVLRTAPLLVLVTVSLVTASAHGEPGGNSESSKIQIGFAIAPVPLDLQGKNPALVGLGTAWLAYLPLGSSGVD